MKFLKYFTRARTFFKILVAIIALIAIVLAFNIVPVIEDFSLSGNSVSRSFLFFFLGASVLIVLIVIAIALYCIIKDAEEDLKAIINMQSNKPNE